LVTSNISLNLKNENHIPFSIVNKNKKTTDTQTLLTHTNTYLSRSRSRLQFSSVQFQRCERGLKYATFVVLDF